MFSRIVSTTSRSSSPELVFDDERADDDARIQRRGPFVGTHAAVVNLGQAVPGNGSGQLYPPVLAVQMRLEGSLEFLYAELT